MLERDLKVKKNLIMLDGLVRGKQRDYKEFMTENKETIVSNELLTILSSRGDLTKYVKEIPVTTGNGTYPYMKLQDLELAEVAKLEENPRLPEADIINIEYELKTYRGEIPISIEVLQDAAEKGIDYGETLAEYSKQIDINTKNREIINLFKNAEIKTITGKDNLTTLINTGFISAYEIKLFISASLYDLLDKANAIDYTKGYPEYKGKEVIKIDDTSIGTNAGDLVGFIGDSMNYIHLFDRESVTLKFTSNKTFSSQLAIATRFDAKVADADAGYYITFTE